MKKSIIWDFDGVIAQSNEIRKNGFINVLRNVDFSEESIQDLIEYHEANGGLSRFNKFDYYFRKYGFADDEEFLEGMVQLYADAYSEEVKNLFNKDTLDKKIIDYIKSKKDIEHHIVSGSYDMELKFICNKLGISNLFSTINGSNRHVSPEINQKIETIKEIRFVFDYDFDEVSMVGDSVNDYEAARENKIPFFGYNYTGKEKINKLF